ncbi:MAG: hypothetical protein JXR95_03805 [Deltaproteobacteria bacterium]|nr:hypothetical protein [Deltaproteobacteria bacterium]
MTKILFTFILLLSSLTAANAFSTPRGRYLRGQRIYREKLWRCAMWWRRLGDIKSSSGKWLTNGTDLVDELGKKSDMYIRRWLLSPSKLPPRVNCQVGTFHHEIEVVDMINFIRTKATNPPRKPVIRRKVLKKSRIRLLKTHAILRQRMKAMKEIKKLRFSNRLRTR